MKRLLAIPMLLALCMNAYAAHPLVTDDTGTQGKGKFQVELNGQYSIDKNNGVTQKSALGGPTVTFGVIDTVDAVVSMPYQWYRNTDGSTTTEHNGIGDTSLAIKWRFFDKDGWSLALKPGVTFPTGDFDKGLGSDRYTASGYLLFTKEFKPFAVHVNGGYIFNNNRTDQRRHLWHASIAGEYEVIKSLRLVANTGIQRNPNKDSNIHPAFVLGGLIYSINEHIDIDAGYKYGLTKPEVNHTWLGGLTFKF